MSSGILCASRCCKKRVRLDLKLTGLLRMHGGSKRLKLLQLCGHSANLFYYLKQSDEGCGAFRKADLDTLYSSGHEEQAEKIAEEHESLI